VAINPSWTGADGRLCEYSRPYKSTKAKRKHPSATAYVHGLYTVPGLPQDQAQYVEKRFMQVTDDLAARALHILLNPGGPAAVDLDARQKIGWARFLYSLTVRNPESLKRMQQMAPQAAAQSLERFRQNYDLLRVPDDPATFEEFKVEFVANPRNIAPQTVLPTLLNSKLVITEIATYRFFTAHINNGRHSLLTSDRPIIMTNGLSVPNAHIAIPISPHRLFVAAKSDDTYNDISRMTPDILIETSNNKVVEQAVKYVYGIDDTHGLRPRCPMGSQRQPTQSATSCCVWPSRCQVRHSRTWRPAKSPSRTASW